MGRRDARLAGCAPRYSANIVIRVSYQVVEARDTGGGGVCVCLRYQVKGLESTNAALAQALFARELIERRKCGSESAGRVPQECQLRVVKKVSWRHSKKSVRWWYVSRHDRTIHWYDSTSTEPAARQPCPRGTCHRSARTAVSGKVDRPHGVRQKARVTGDRSGRPCHSGCGAGERHPRAER